MSVDPALLLKAAKVYEAAEAVEGMKPKEVYKSHKKCAPGEFGMNKEGEEASVIGPGTGATIGGIGGATLATLIALFNKSRLQRMQVMGVNPFTSRAANETANMGITGGIAGAGVGALGGYLYDQHQKNKKPNENRQNLQIS